MIFPSITAACEYAKGGAWFSRGGEWEGGYTNQKAIDAVLDGNACPQNALDRAKALVSKVNASFTGRTAPVWKPSVCGAYPMVPDALAGFPTPMRQQMHEEKPTAPLNVYIEAAVSCGVEVDELYSRAAGITAFILRLSQTRPVKLHLFAAWNMYTKNNDEVFWSAPLASNPVGLYQVMNTMGAVCFNRPVNFNISSNIHKALSLAGKRKGYRPIDNDEGFGWAGGSDRNRDTLIRAEFGLTKHDIIMQRGYLTDAYEFGSDPVAWVNKQVDLYRHVEA
jgi:hypothetical protein